MMWPGKADNQLAHAFILFRELNHLLYLLGDWLSVGTRGFNEWALPAVGTGTFVLTVFDEGRFDLILHDSKQSRCTTRKFTGNDEVEVVRDIVSRVVISNWMNDISKALSSQSEWVSYSVPGSTHAELPLNHRFHYDNHFLVDLGDVAIWKTKLVNEYAWKSGNKLA